jgi:hypothetical protein
MGETNGFIKIHRKLLKWEWYDDVPTKTLFLHLLMTVNFTPGRYHGHDIPAGSGVYGLHKLREETGLSIQQIRTSLKKLESTQEINKQTTNKFSIISITRWDEYQINNKRATNEQQTTNNNIRSKEYKNNIPCQKFEELWHVFPKQRAGNKTKAYQAYLKTIKEGRSTAEELLEAVKNYSKSDEVARGYACGGARYFNDDKFNQDCSKPKQYEDDDDDFYYPPAAQ